MAEQSHIDLGEKSAAIIGGGLVGCLLAVYLRQHGYTVAIFESRADPRIAVERGRSINLVITSRGLHALTSLSAGLAEKVMKVTTRVEGRTLHNASGETTYQSYGPTSSFCNFSVSRWTLNRVLMDAAEEAGCTLHFSHPVAHVDIPNNTAYFYLPPPALSQKSITASLVVGADGGGSRCRQALMGMLKSPTPVAGAAATASEVVDENHPLGYGYKELFMPAIEGAKDQESSYAVHNESLHIWPRGSHFIMGLANVDDGSFTMTLYAHEKGHATSFDQLRTKEAVEGFLLEHYPTALKLMPTAVEDFLNRPVGFLGTVFCSPWVHSAPVTDAASSSSSSSSKGFTLIGDSAHAFTPFFGQGCNSGFEDVSVFHDVLTKHEAAAAASGASSSVDLGAVLSEFYGLRKPCTDAIANMALENFDEMMAKTADPRFLLEKEIENTLSLEFPDTYVSRYALITHSLLPYNQCMAVGKVQQAILSELSENIKTVEELDLGLAKTLVEGKLRPFLDEHIGAASWTEQNHYTSPYYERPTSSSSP